MWKPRSYCGNGCIHLHRMYLPGTEGVPGKERHITFCDIYPQRRIDWLETYAQMRPQFITDEEYSFPCYEPDYITQELINIYTAKYNE